MLPWPSKFSDSSTRIAESQSQDRRIGGAWQYGYDPSSPAIWSSTSEQEPKPRPLATAVYAHHSGQTLAVLRRRPRIKSASRDQDLGMQEIARRTKCAPNLTILSSWPTTRKLLRWFLCRRAQTTSSEPFSMDSTSSLSQASRLAYSMSRSFSACQKARNCRGVPPSSALRSRHK